MHVYVCTYVCVCEFTHDSSPTRCRIKFFRRVVAVDAHSKHNNATGAGQWASCDGTPPATLHFPRPLTPALSQPKVSQLKTVHECKIIRRNEEVGGGKLGAPCRKCSTQHEKYTKIYAIHERLAAEWKPASTSCTPLMPKKFRFVAHGNLFIFANMSIE